MAKRNDGTLLRSSFDREIRHLRTLKLLFLQKAEDLSPAALDEDAQERLGAVRAEVDGIMQGIGTAIEALFQTRALVVRQSRAYDRLPQRAYKPTHPPHAGLAEPEKEEESCRQT